MKNAGFLSSKIDYFLLLVKKSIRFWIGTLLTLKNNVKLTPTAPNCLPEESVGGEIEIFL